MRKFEHLPISDQYKRCKAHQVIHVLKLGLGSHALLVAAFDEGLQHSLVPSHCNTHPHPLTYHTTWTHSHTTTVLISVCTPQVATYMCINRNRLILENIMHSWRKVHILERWNKWSQGIVYCRQKLCVKLSTINFNKCCTNSFSPLTVQELVILNGLLLNFNSP